MRHTLGSWVLCVCVWGHFGEGEGQGLQEQDILVSMSLPVYSHLITIVPDSYGLGRLSPSLPGKHRIILDTERGRGQEGNPLCCVHAFFQTTSQSLLKLGLGFCKFLHPDFSLSPSAGLLASEIAPSSTPTVQGHFLSLVFSPGSNLLLLLFQFTVAFKSIFYFTYNLLLVVIPYRLISVILDWVHPDDPILTLLSLKRLFQNNKVQS